MTNLDKGTPQAENIVSNNNNITIINSVDPSIDADNNNAHAATNADHAANLQAMKKLFPEALVPEATEIYEKLKANDQSYDLNNPKRTSLLQIIKEEDLRAFTSSLNDVDLTNPSVRKTGLEKNVNAFRKNLDNRIYFKVIDKNSSESQKIAILLRILREWKRTLKKQTLSQLKQELAKAKEQANAAKDELRASKETLAKEEKYLSDKTAEINSLENKLTDKKTVDHLKKLRGSIKGLEGQLKKSTDANKQEELRKSISDNEQQIQAQELINQTMLSTILNLKEEKKLLLSSSTEKVELNKNRHQKTVDEIQSLLAKINLTRIQNKLLPEEFVSKIKEICPEVTAKFDHEKNSITVYDKENNPLIKIKTTADNHKRFVISNENNDPVLEKKVAIHHKNEGIKVGVSNININLDEYVYDANGVATPRYIVRSITPQERAALAEYSIDAGLLPLDHHATEITPLEKATYENNVKKGTLNSQSLKDPLIVSSILHRTGTRRLICASAYEAKEVSTKFTSNSDKAFFNGNDNFQTYMPNTRGSDKFNDVVYIDTIKVSGGGMILIDLAKIPQECIFTQGKRDSAIKIVGVEKTGKSTRSYGEFEQTFAMISAYRNKEIHLAEISPGSIMAWLPSAEGDWQTSVTHALYYENGNVGDKKPLTIEAVNAIEGRVQPGITFDAFIKPVDKKDVNISSKEKFTLFATQKDDRPFASVITANNTVITDNNSVTATTTPSVSTNSNTLFAAQGNLCPMATVEGAEKKKTAASIPTQTKK